MQIAIDLSCRSAFTVAVVVIRCFPFDYITTINNSKDSNSNGVPLSITLSHSHHHQQQMQIQHNATQHSNNTLQTKLNEISQAS